MSRADSLDAAARKLTGVPAEQREIEKSLASEIASAAGLQGGLSGRRSGRVRLALRALAEEGAGAPPTRSSGGRRIVRGRCSHDL